MALWSLGSEGEAGGGGGGGEGKEGRGTVVVEVVKNGSECLCLC